jgi:phosphohistidine phosphatase SixA
MKMRDGARVILFRHGIAEPKTSRPDEERRLTVEGRRELTEVARGMARLLPDADAIRTSPLVRALETATILAVAYDNRVPVRPTDTLTPDADVEKFRDLLAALDTRCAYFVGHEPTLSSFMRTLTAIHGDLEPGKAGCYGLRWRSGGRLELEWMLTAEVVRGLSSLTAR